MRKCKLGEIADIITGPFGSQLHASDYVEKGVPSIMPKDIGDRIVIHDTIAHITEEDATRLSKYRVELGDIVYSRRGDIERCALITEADVGDLCGTGCLRVRPDKGLVNPVFLSFYLSTPHIKKWVVDNATGATMPNLNSAILKKMPLELPDLDVQCKIAKELQVIDDKINTNSKLILTLESMAKTLYDYWFVQFDFPDANGRPYKTSGGKMEWNENLSREIPAGWEVQKIGSLIKKQKSIKSIERKNYSANGKYPIVDQSAEYIAGYTNDEVNALEGEESIIVFGDHTRILKYVDFPFAIGADGTQRIVSINKERMPQILFYYSLSRIDLSNYGYARHYKFLKDSVIVVPQKDVASNFEIQVKCWHQIISKIIRENRYLAEMRDFLMPMLMNGQVKILDEREAF